MGGLFCLFLLAESGSGKSTLIKLLINNLNQGTEPYFLNINLVAVDISHTPVYVI
jgi:ABC-type multidrug transport system ATPase subunit